MLAKRLPSILPPSLWERVWKRPRFILLPESWAKTVDSSRNARSAPHHTISTVAMTGGGSFPSPVKSVWHITEFYILMNCQSTAVTYWRVLRQPLEDRKITVSRIRCNVEYPASFMLVASMNPCPCGITRIPPRLVYAVLDKYKST